MSAPDPFAHVGRFNKEMPTSDDQSVEELAALEFEVCTPDIIDRGR